MTLIDNYNIIYKVVKKNGQLIKQTKKEIQNLTYELKTIEGTKRLEKKRRK